MTTQVLYPECRADSARWRFVSQSKRLEWINQAHIQQDITEKGGPLKMSEQPVLP